ncbi:hypothetical protein [Flavobacterium sp.]|uniref:hypothetical protein n=1 Tax=Flavobacterium sp. TaxID=239 RepID=UPI0037502499
MEEELYITKKQVVQVISNYLEPVMTEYGFKWIKTKDEFVKKNNEWSFHILLNSKNFWPLKQEFNIPISIVNQKVNKIRMKIFNNIKSNEPLFHKWLVLPNSNELEHKELYTIEDIEIAKIESLKIIKNEGLPFFACNSTLEQIAEYSKEKNYSVALISSKLFKESVYESNKIQIIGSDIFRKCDLDYRSNIEKLIKLLDEM